MNTLIALDFETADYKPDSACSIGMVRIENNKITDSFSSLIRPPRKQFFFTHIHGITWEDVQDAPNFCTVWQEAQSFLTSADAFIAHNASFDRKVLYSCCQSSSLPIPSQQFLCTLKASRRYLKLKSHALNNVCDYFNIPLIHHRADADALGAAKIYLELLTLGMKPEESQIK